MTRTDMPTKDYLGEMRRCSKCKRKKDKSEFYKLAKGGVKLQSWCKQCHHDSMAIVHEKDRKEKLAKEKIEKARVAFLRKDVLRQPSFVFQNGYTLNIIPIYENFKIELCAGQEEMAVLIPNDRAELLRDWLNVKLKQEKE